MQQQGIGTRWVQQVLLCAATTNECAPTAAKPQQEQAPVPLGMLFWKQWGKKVLKTAKLQPKGEILKDKLCRRIYIHQKHHSVRPGWAGRQVVAKLLWLMLFTAEWVAGKCPREKATGAKRRWEEFFGGSVLSSEGWLEGQCVRTLPRDVNGIWSHVVWSQFWIFKTSKLWINCNYILCKSVV